jgi:hypothetical protein
LLFYTIRVGIWAQAKPPSWRVLGQ